MTVNTRNAVLWMIGAPLLWAITLWSEQGTTAPFRFPLTWGPYAVGFKSIDHYDYTRTFYSGYDTAGRPVSENARPMQTSIWYPANPAAADSPRMTFADYLALFGRQLEFPPDTAARRETAIRTLLQGWGIPESRHFTLKHETRAIRDAAPAPGAFPLVIYAPSMNSLSVENDVLCEYLASFGYIAAATPSTGRRCQSLTMDLEDTEAQARDLEFLIGFMRSFPGADRERIALVGFSRGAMANVLTAMRDSRIDALVCLDSALRAPSHHLGQSADFRPDHLAIPSLFIISRDIPDEFYQKAGVPVPTDRSFAFYESLKYADAWLIQFHKLVHYDFASALIRLMEPDPSLAAPVEEIVAGYAQVCGYVKSFLDGCLKQDPNGFALLAKKPEEAGIPATLATIKFKKALEAPPAPGRFFFTLRERGIEHIGALYADVKTRFPGYAIPPDRFIDFGWKEAEARQWDNVIAIFRFFAAEFPKHPLGSEAWFAVGEAWREKGDVPQARAAYEKAMALAPYDQRIKKKLESLK